MLRHLFQSDLRNVHACIVALVGLLTICVLSRMSMPESAMGAQGQQQVMWVARRLLRRRLSSRLMTGTTAWVSLHKCDGTFTEEEERALREVEEISLGSPEARGA